MEGRFDWGRYDFGTFRRRDVLTMGRSDCKALREWLRCPLVVHYCVDWATLQSAHGFRCCDNMAPNAKCQRVLVLAHVPG